MTDQPVETIYSEDQKRRIVIFRRQSGTYGYREEYHYKNELAHEAGWSPLSGRACHYEDLQTAKREVIENVPWLAQQNRQNPDHDRIPMTASEPERVHTMTGYYDGPRNGVADYHGRPHIYESLFQDAADGSDVFLLQPIEDETFRLVLEDWAIWCKWEKAFYNQQTTQSTHPALPEDRARHEELEKPLSARLRVNERTALRVRGRFDARKPAQAGLTSTAELIVYWMSQVDPQHPET